MDIVRALRAEALRLEILAQLYQDDDDRKAGTFTRCKTEFLPHGRCIYGVGHTVECSPGDPLCEDSRSS